MLQTSSSVWSSEGAITAAVPELRAWESPHLPCSWASRQSIMEPISSAYWVALRSLPVPSTSWGLLSAWAFPACMVNPSPPAMCSPDRLSQPRGRARLPLGPLPLNTARWLVCVCPWVSWVSQSTVALRLLSMVSFHSAVSRVAPPSHRAAWAGGHVGAHSLSNGPWCRLTGARPQGEA